MQSSAWQFAETFAYVEINQRADFEKRHLIFNRVRFRFSGTDLSIELQMESISN